MHELTPKLKTWLDQEERKIRIKKEKLEKTISELSAKTKDLKRRARLQQTLVKPTKRDTSTLTVPSRDTSEKTVPRRNNRIQATVRHRRNCPRRHRHHRHFGRVALARFGQGKTESSQSKK